MDGSINKNNKNYIPIEIGTFDIVSKKVIV